MECGLRTTKNLKNYLTSSRHPRFLVSVRTNLCRRLKKCPISRFESFEKVGILRLQFQTKLPGFFHFRIQNFFVKLERLF